MKIQLLFSISILPSIALKRGNFPDNLEFKGKTVAKFLLRSHFLSICNNMTVKQHSNTDPFKKYVTCIMAFFIPLTCVTLFQFYSITSVVFSLKTTNYGMREEKIFCIYGCFSVSCYIKGGRKLCLQTQTQF